MPSPLIVILCALLGALYWTALGYPIARFVGLAKPLAVAPALGWAVHLGASALILRITGFSALSVAALALLALAGAGALMRYAEPAAGHRLRIWPIVAAALAAAVVAAIPAAALLPMLGADGGVTLTGPIFDHAKMAIIDEISRGNLPPLNPFFYEAGKAATLAYYWGWYASAAQLAILTGTTGWTAEIACTWFTGFASVALVMGLAVSFSGRMLAAGWAALACVTSDLYNFLNQALPAPVTGGLLSLEAGGVGPWLGHMTWAPQHVAGATCVVLAAMLMVRLGNRRGVVAPVALGLVAAAGVAASAYTGGFVMAAASPLIALLVLWWSADRAGFVLRVLLAGAIALAFAAPAIMDQVAVVAARTEPSVALRMFKPLGSFFPPEYHKYFNGLAFWTLLLLIRWPGVYVAGVAAAGLGVLGRRGVAGQRRLEVAALVLVALAGLVVTFRVRTIIGNNDLGWRANIPSFLALSAFTAAGLASWFRSRVFVALCTILIAFSLPRTIEDVRNLYAGFQPGQPAGRLFAASPALWEAVRKHAGPQERVANNPLYLAAMTPWPTNISWAALSNRRSCFAVWEMVGVYSPLGLNGAFDVAQIYNRVFAGAPEPDDLARMAHTYGCTTVVITPEDGAWSKDPFVASPTYKLVEDAPDWRIYRTTE